MNHLLFIVTNVKLTLKVCHFRNGCQKKNLCIKRGIGSFSGTCETYDWKTFKKRNQTKFV